MKASVQAGIVGFALSNLFLLSLTGPLVSPQHELVFHLPASATVFFIPTIVDILLVAVAITVALLVTRPYRRAELLLWSALLLSLPSGLITTIYGFNNARVPLWLGWPVAIVALLVFLRVNLRGEQAIRRFRRIRPRIVLFLSFLAFAEVLLFVQLLWYGWQARNLNPPFTPAPASASASSGTAAQRPRVLWILLDELAYDQVYGHRYPGLQLPNFDRLAAESSIFTQASPAAGYTRRAMPSMFTGAPLARTHPSASGRTLALLRADTGKWSTLDPQDTVFGDAQRAGLQTAIAGWYEPYCRILPGVLNRCFWTYSDELPAGLTTHGTLLQHAVEPFMHFLRLTFRPAGIGPTMPAPGAIDVRRHRADYFTLLKASDVLLTSGQPGLTLIHMPIPHPWGFYDRKTGTFPEHRTSYLDNLALADLYIGRVRAQLEAKGLWENTNVLVMGDHSWRTSTVWANSAHWTPEEQAASHNGAIDDRPAVILKLSGQQGGSTVNTPFSSVRTRALIDALISGQMKTAADLQQWVAAPPQP